MALSPQEVDAILRAHYEPAIVQWLHEDAHFWQTLEKLGFVDVVVDCDLENEVLLIFEELKE